MNRGRVHSNVNLAGGCLAESKKSLACPLAYLSRSSFHLIPYLFLLSPRHTGDPPRVFLYLPSFPPSRPCSHLAVRHCFVARPRLKDPVALALVLPKFYPSKLYDPTRVLCAVFVSFLLSPSKILLVSNQNGQFSFRPRPFTASKDVLYLNPR